MMLFHYLLPSSSLQSRRSLFSACLTLQTAVLADVVARIPGGDPDRQRSRLPQRLHRAIPAHGNQLFHRITGDRRYNGRSSRDAARRIQRGT